MKKEQIRGIIAMVTVLAVYFLLVLVIPFADVAEVKISIGFTVLAFAVVAYAVYIAFVKKPDARSRFYGFPIARLGLIYLVFQAVAGFVFMALGAYIPWWVSVVVYALALAAAVLGLISAESVVEEIEILDQKLKKDVAAMRAIQSKANQMASLCADPAVKKFAEEVRYSDPVSSDALAEIERDLTAAVDDLQSAIVDGDNANIPALTRKASAVLAERNRLCKLNKG